MDEKDKAIGEAKKLYEDERSKAVQFERSKALQEYEIKMTKETQEAWKKGYAEMEKHHKMTFNQNSNCT